MIGVKKEVNKMVKSVLLDHLKFKQERKASKLTQERIAERLGISERHVRNLEAKDISVSIKILYQISNVFGKPMDYFLKIIEKD